MKRLNWYSPRSETPIIEVVLSAESAQWIADHIPDGDRAKVELLAAVLECTAVETTTAPKGEST
jgi:hypothetical protein